MKFLLLFTVLVSANILAGEAHYLCGKDSGFPIVISVENKRVTTYEDEWYNSKCVNGMTEEEVRDQLAVIEEKIEDGILSEQEELAMAKKLMLNNPNFCIENGPSSLVSFIPETSQLVELSMKDKSLNVEKCEALAK